MSDRNNGIVKENYLNNENKNKFDENYENIFKKSEDYVKTVENKTICELCKSLDDECNSLIESLSNLEKLLSEIENECHNYQEDLEGYQILNIIEKYKKDNKNT